MFLFLSFLIRGMNPEIVKLRMNRLQTVKLSPFAFLPYLFGFQRTYDPHFYSSWVILQVPSVPTHRVNNVSRVSNLG